MTTVSADIPKADVLPSTAATKLANLRVAQVMGRYGGGGAERVTYNLAAELHRMGAASFAIAIGEPGSYPALDNSGLPVITLGAKRDSKLSVLRAMSRFRRAVREHRIDLLHVHGGDGSLPFVVLALAGMRRKPKIAYTFHHRGLVYYERGWKLHLRLACLRRCCVFYGDSHEIRDKVTSVDEFADRARVFANAVPESPPAQDIAHNPPTVVWMARVTPIKDPQALIRAAAKLKAEGLDFRVVLAGEARDYEADFMQRTRDLIDQFDLTDRVDMPGWVDDTPALMRRAQIGVQTSLSEGLSLTLLEQMMTGLCIVATDVADTSVAIEHEQTGLLIPPEDEGALVEALRRVITDRDLRVRLAAAARTAAIDRFSIAAAARRTIDEYRAVIDEKPLP